MKNTLKSNHNHTPKQTLIEPRLGRLSFIREARGSVLFIFVEGKEVTKIPSPRMLSSFLGK
jgi:hypothetical protein